MKMNQKQKNKRNFRASRKWKDFRHKIYVKQGGLCYITHKKLNKYANLHHIDLDEKNYENLSIEENFVFVNKMMHGVIHDLYRYFVNDEEVLDRIKYVLIRMKEVNNKNAKITAE